MADHNILNKEKLNNLHHSLVISETDTNMGKFLISEQFELILKLKKQTVSIHELFMFGLVGVLLFFEISNTDDSLRLAKDTVLLTDLLHSFFVLIFAQQELSVFVGNSVEKNITIDTWVFELLTNIINSLNDVSSNLTHLIKRRQM